MDRAPRARGPNSILPWNQPTTRPVRAGRRRFGNVRHAQERELRPRRSASSISCVAVFRPEIDVVQRRAPRSLAPDCDVHEHGRSERGSRVAGSRLDPIFLERSAVAQRASS